MAIALAVLKRHKKIETAFVPEINFHFGDGTVNILENTFFVTVYNLKATRRKAYLEEVASK